eukprot:2197115-Rhodomonas_salina.1
MRAGYALSTKARHDGLKQSMVLVEQFDEEKRPDRRNRVGNSLRLNSESARVQRWQKERRQSPGAGHAQHGQSENARDK